MKQIIVLPINSKSSLKLTVEVLQEEDLEEMVIPDPNQIDIMDLLRSLSASGFVGVGVSSDEDEDEDDDYEGYEEDEELENLHVGPEEQELKPLSVLETNPEQKLMPVIKVGE